MKVFHHEHEKPSTRCLVGGAVRVLVALASCSVVIGFTVSVEPLPSPSVSSSLSSTITPWARAILDYSAANEYMEHYYGISNYFNVRTSPETIYNARRGVLRRNGNNQDQLVKPTLDSCGFTLIDLAPSSSQPDTMDWNNMSHIRNIFLPRARHALLQAYASMPYVKVRDAIFWKPTLRDGPSTHVSPVHMDIDVNAYRTVDEFLDFIWSCRVPEQEQEDSQDATVQRDMWKHALERGARFCITNLWQKVDRVAVQNNNKDAPLALLRTEYDNKDFCEVDAFGLCPSDYEALDRDDQDDKDSRERWSHNHKDQDSASTDDDVLSSWPAFPRAQPSPRFSRWYTFPNVTSDDLVVFTQYDRDVRTTTDMWHCALTKIVAGGCGSSNNGNGNHRHSFDVRCLVLLDETVPLEWDRWTSAHQLPMRPEAWAKEN